MSDPPKMYALSIADQFACNLTAANVTATGPTPTNLAAGRPESLGAA